MGESISVNDFPEIRWLGHWIWVPEEPIVPSGCFARSIDFQAKEAHGLFRKTFSLESVPGRVPARITADSRYALYVNGQEIGRGPIHSQFRRLHYDLYDLAPYLQVGLNVIAVYVKYYGQEKAFWTPATPNRILGKRGILVFEGNFGQAGWLVSDATWKAQLARAWEHPAADGRELSAEGVPVEIFDARRFPHDWKTAAYDDSAWGQGQVVHAMLTGLYRSHPPTHPYGPLYPRSIGQLTGELRRPASIETQMILELAVQPGISPMERVDQALGAQRSSQLQEQLLPAGFDVPGGGGVWVKMDMGPIVSGFVQFNRLSRPLLLPGLAAS